MDVTTTSRRLAVSTDGDPSVEMRNVQRYHISLTVSGVSGLSAPSVNKYPAKQHARKVASKLGISHGLIYLIGKHTVLFDDSDQAVVFRQRRYFYYLSGVNSPDCHLTYDVRNDLLTLYVPNFNLRQAVWMGPTLTVEEALEKFDIDEAKYVSSLASDIDSWLQHRKHESQIFILHPDQRPPSKYAKKDVDAERLQPAMDASRGVKDATEIELIRRANVISALAHTAILENIGRMTKESEIAALFLETCMSHGAPEQAYGIIAASGENAAILHYMKNDEPFGSRPLVCLDAGAEFSCYASDVTRTFPTGSTGDWPNPESRNIYRAVERMQEECIQLIKPGVHYRDIHVHAHNVAIEELLKLGIFKKGSVQELKESGASTVFFPHGLGHHVGLEVHDVSEKSIMAHENGHEPTIVPGFTHTPCTMSAVPLEENMIVTVEPGIYFNRLAIENARKLPVAQFIDFDVVERYIPIGGVRIEDDILVTAEGYENLTTAPKGEKALEIIRKSNRRRARTE